jgi:DNA-binding SARP family transcriptional activator
MLLSGRAGMASLSTFPIAGVRIHPPLLRPDTLSRERLNTWLDQATTGRLALIVAEAGFGKTTLLADWARQSSRLTAWYRLEPDDRDWLTFTRHLVASGRELDPDFASETFALLMQLGPGGPTPDDIRTTLAAEFASFGSSHPQGLTLIFDDYHIVDGSPEVVPTVRSLLDLTGQGFSIVIASRSVPKLPLSRLRARGSISRLTGDALCFEAAEADRLFRDAYHLPLERDVIDELVERTDGWAALLSLVRANLEEKPGTDGHALVAQLTAGQGDLYDYVAEEVLESLPRELQEFLDRVSVLAVVDAAAASLVDDRSADEIVESIADAERLGLLTRPDPEAPHRFHPLVREFLAARLEATIGRAAVEELHRRLGAALESRDWWMSAWHYRAAGDDAEAARVLDAAIDHIYAFGQFERTRPYIDGRTSSDRTTTLLLRSRIELGRGNHERALELARRAVETAVDGQIAGLALLNLASVQGIGGIPEAAFVSVEKALQESLTPAQRNLATATVALWEAEHEGNLEAIADNLRDLAIQQSRAGEKRYAAVTRVNLAGILIWLGRPREAIQTGALAEVTLGEPGNPEYVAAVAARATGIAQLGRLDEAVGLLSPLLDTGSVLDRDEAAVELAKILVHFGSVNAAQTAFVHVGAPYLKGIRLLVGGNLAIRHGDLNAASQIADELRVEPCRDAAGLMRGQLLRARIAVLARSPNAAQEIAELKRIALVQHSRPGSICADLLERLRTDGPVGAEVVRLLPDEMYLMSMLAEELADALDRITIDARVRIIEECKRRPERWSSALRRSVNGDAAAGPMAAAILADIGDRDDAAFLREIGGERKSVRPAALAITKRLAPRIQILDLGPVNVAMDGVPIARPLRRKVLGLLCYLSSRPGQAASRDEVIDALWPDLGPDTAANSLHQTIYFARRIFEPDYREGMSAGYVRFDGEVIGLDAETVDSTSRQAWGLVAACHRGDDHAIDDLLDIYTAKFALDFAYEEWTSSYRDNLHAAVLDVCEVMISEAHERSDFDRAIQLAHRALGTDPTADAIELMLIRAYKAASRHAAAAEQYAHYTSVLSDQLGIEAPAYDSI